MKNKKFSILLMVLGVVLLLVGVILMIIGADEKESKMDNSDTNNVVNSNEDKCKYIYSKDGNLSFVYGNENDNLYLNISYSGNNIFHLRLME